MQIRDILKSVFSDNPPEPAVAEFVHLCRNIALVLLRKKAGAGRLNLARISLTMEDLALDCVADLFSRNDEGKYTQIRVYLGGVDLDRAEEPELMSHMRRLVFSRVNQGIFRIYHETDPSLSRIIRNMKLSVQALNNFTLVDRFGEHHLLPVACDPLEHLPFISPELLRDGLTGKTGKTLTIPELMSRLSRCLREQEQWCRLVPLVRVALVFRSLFGGVDTDNSVPSEAENSTSATDAREVIARACVWIRNGALKKYVGSGKVPEELFDNYFKVIEAALIRVILDRDGEEISYYQDLLKWLPEMTKSEYKSRHKARIEYLGRLAHRRVIEELKAMF